MKRLNIIIIMAYKPFEYVQYILSKLNVKNTNYITYKTIDKATIVKQLMFHDQLRVLYKRIQRSIFIKNNLLLNVCKNYQKRSPLHTINDIVFSIIYLLKANYKINL